MAQLVKQHGPAPIGTRPFFLTLARAVVSQQLSTHAAGAILGRIDSRVGIKPAKLARVRRSTLRGLGLSASKTECLREVARLTARGELDDLADLSDDGVLERLTAIKGVGPWTAQIVMIFGLGRPDVWPVGDGGIQRAALNLYGVEKEGLVELGERFRPLRSHAAWYLWRSL